MTRTALRVALTALVLHLVTSHGYAQGIVSQRQPRVPVLSIAVNGGIQGAGSVLADRVEVERFVETAVIESVYRGGETAIIDAGAHVRIWKQLGAGVAVSRVARSGPARIDARVPHPFFFDEPRLVSGESDRLARSETAVHLLGSYTLDPPGPLAVIVSGGPSVIRAAQELVSDVRYAEAYPFDTATFTGAETTRSRGSALGVSLGGDVIWMLGSRFGVGGLLRFSRAAIPLTAADGRTVSIRAGGFQAAAGVRVTY